MSAEHKTAPNRYDLQSAVHKVEGYDLRITPRQSRQDEFNKAKKECLSNLHAALSHVESLTLEQYVAIRKERTSLAETSVEQGEVNENY